MLEDLGCVDENDDKLSPTFDVTFQAQLFSIMEFLFSNNLSSKGWVLDFQSCKENRFLLNTSKVFSCLGASLTLSLSA